MSDTATLIAVGAGVLAVIDLVLSCWFLLWMRRVRRAQRAILAGRPVDLVEFAVGVQSHMEHVAAELEHWREEVIAGLARIDGAHQRRAIVRYDALGEAAGLQSFSVALLDNRGDGLVITALQGLDTVRVYAKEVVRGAAASLELAPEEKQAVDRARS